MYVGEELDAPESDEDITGRAVVSRLQLPGVQPHWSSEQRTSKTHVGSRTTIPSAFTIVALEETQVNTTHTQLGFGFADRLTL